MAVDSRVVEQLEAQGMGAVREEQAVYTGASTEWCWSIRSGGMVGCCGWFT